MRSFFRMLGFLRPFRRAVAVSFALSCTAIVGTVSIPLLLGESVDAIKSGERSHLLPFAVAIVGAGLIRIAFSVPRRLIAGRVSLGVGFFDRQQVGQLMSRATVDLQAIRFFLGYGLVFILQNLLTILLAAGVMFYIQPSLAAITLAPVPIVIVAAARYGR